LTTEFRANSTRSRDVSTSQTKRGTRWEFVCFQILK